MKIILIMWIAFNGDAPAGLVIPRTQVFDDLKSCSDAANKVISQVPNAAARCFYQLEA
jgi:hypothetical protein